jgi:hypothetical protein
MQAVLDRWAIRREIVPPELTGRIAPTRLEVINLRGVFRLPLERYAGQILPSQTRGPPRERVGHRRLSPRRSAAIGRTDAVRTTPLGAWG